MKTISVAYVVHSLGTGGIERSVTRIVNRLDPNRFRASIICMEKTGAAQDWLEQPTPVIEIAKRGGNDLAAVRRLADALREQRADIVQSHNWGTLMETVAARRLAGTPFHVHAERGTVLGMVEPRGVRHWLRARAMRLALSRVDRVVSNSRTVAQRVEQRCGYGADRITIIPNGVPSHTLDDRCQINRKMREELGIDTQSVVIGSIGRLVHVKGFDYALQAFSQVLQSRPDAHLVFVGDGPERDKLSEMAVELGVESKTHFVGHRDNVDQWLAMMDIYLNSSRSEGMSQSIIEAMAASLPIVATDVGDSRFVIGPAEQSAGICVPSGDANQLANALLEMAGSTDVRLAYARHSKQRHREHFSENQLAHNCESLYQELFDSVAHAGSG